MSDLSSDKEETERTGKGRRAQDIVPLNVVMFKVLAWALLALQAVAVYLYADLKTCMDRKISEAVSAISVRSAQGELATSAKMVSLEATINSLDNKKVDLQLFNQAMNTINSNQSEISRKMDKMLDMHTRQGYR